MPNGEQGAGPGHQGEEPDQQGAGPDQATCIDSLCINCHKDGVTRLMLSSIPFYKEVVVMSFHCDYCGYHNNELRDAGVIPEKGIRLKLNVQRNSDLNRKCVRTDHAAVSIPELQLEMPSQSQKGEITTVEGIIDRVITGLQQDQESRRRDHPEDAEKLDEFIAKLVRLKDVEANGTFHLMIEDISGNSHIENPLAPSKDPNLAVTYFERNKEQNHQLGVFTHGEVDDDNKDKEPEMAESLLVPITEGDHSLEAIQGGEVMSFRTNCPDCNAPCDTNMKMTAIPHFKEVVIMATNCEQCGHRTNEVKSGGGIEDKGLRIEVKVNSKDDFSRDILKSDTCSLIVPELELESGPRSLCGRFTTVEGILKAMRDQLAGNNSMIAGDSALPGSVDRMETFIQRLDMVLEAKTPVTLILDDPAGNSYVQTLNDDGTLDDSLTIVHYERNYEQNEELGLNDMKTEGYDRVEREEGVAIASS